jgi:predicted metal-dependent HD superfamily phosphohydrolase
MKKSARSFLSLEIISEAWSIKEITAFLWINPDKAWDRWDALITPNWLDTGKKYAFTAWFLNSQCPQEENDLNKHIESLFKRITTVKTKMKDLPEVKISLNFNIYIYEKDESPNIYIAPTSVKKIDSIGASISIEVWK